MDKYKVELSKLITECGTLDLPFENTGELKKSKEIIGQERAVRSIEFGLNMKKKGYNIFVTGQSGTGRNSYLKSVTNEKAKNEKTPPDWVYVYDFKKPGRPLSLELPTGKGRQFSKDIDRLMDILKKEIVTVFFSKEYENAKSELVQRFESEYEDIINKINEIAKKYGFKFNTVEGDKVVSVPMRKGRPLKESQLSKLTEEELEEIKENGNKLNVETIELFNDLRVLKEGLDKEMNKLNKTTANKIISTHVEELKRKYSSNEVINFLFSLEEDISENIENIKSALKPPTEDKMLSFMQSKMDNNFLERYKVNVFLEKKENEGAPVIFETNPTYYNLMGSIEYTNDMGVMKTSFKNIKPGALHYANGGYLIIQAKDLFNNPFAWAALKRTLLTGEIKIESLERQMGYVVASTLKPKSIPVNVKVIIVGDSYSYHMLYSYDQDFKKLFKVLSEFDIEMKKTTENIEKMSRFIATRCELKGLRHFNKKAVCKIIEFSSRLSEDQEKISAKLNSIVEVIDESSYWAECEESNLVDDTHVDKALEEKTFRNNMIQEKILDMFKEEDYLLDVSGKRVGEINGLAVTGTGEYSFGKPSRITVSTYVGKAGIINIEREAKTSGKIHDKGMMIISGYLGSKYAQDNPLSLTASVVFEQQYSGIDGDSASSTELYAILSSISEIPINQQIAVTGSVNQRGEIQPIGGVNEKIEGFYKVCKIKGITGEQGVMIPHQNVKNLMLGEEVKEAIKENKFHIYSVRTIDEGIEVLTGEDSKKIHQLVKDKFNSKSKSEKDK